MKRGKWLGLLGMLIGLGVMEFLGNQPQSAKAEDKIQPSSAQLTPVTQPSTCPPDLETLASLLLQDLPSYTNRVIQRSRQLDSNDVRSYVILAGKPEFDPLKLSEQQYTPLTSEAPEQLFFTTLERQYFGDRIVKTQNYHWVFLTQTPGGWRLVMIFSQLGTSAKEKPPLPPRETSNSAIGQGIQLWLRDCRAGVIRSR